MKNQMESFLYGVSLLFFLTSLSGCKENKPENKLAYVLEVQSAQNRQELEKVLRYYREEKPDKEKLAAAEFLISNMLGHASPFLIGKRISVNLDSVIRKADAELYAFVSSVIEAGNEYSESAKQEADAILNQQKEGRDASLLNSSAYSTFQRIGDCKHIKAAFLIRHIDHAFSVRNSRLSQLSFEHFCEYLLPYKVDPNYPLIDSVQNYYTLMNKYFKDIPVDSVCRARERYMHISGNFRNVFGTYPYADTKIGLEEMFFAWHKYYDCTSISHYATALFRACGYPAAMECNIAYKQFQDRHFHCVMPDKDGKWHVFSPDGGIMTPSFDEYDDSDECMNIYRFMYSTQDRNPCFLRNEGEYIPPELASPFTRDVSREHKRTVSLTLPVKMTEDNNLAYLATFSSQRNEGITPVTWGRMNRIRSSATFENVVIGETGRLYFLIYYSKDGRMHLCGDPFFLDTNARRIYYPEPGDAGAKAPARLTRKFPRKRTLLKRADALTGTVILGSKEGSFSPPDTLAVIGFRLDDRLQDIVLNVSKGPYTDYEIKVPAGASGEWIQEVHFFCNPKKDSAEAAFLPGFPAFPSFTYEDFIYDSKDLVKMKSAPRGNGQKRDRNKLYLEKPGYVRIVRLRPSSADNGIKPGNQYALMEWRDKRWSSVSTQTATSNSLQFELQQHRLYWLKNLTEGREEGPFLIDASGNQRFIYDNENK